MNNFWLKKYGKRVTDVRKGKAMERRFPSSFQVFQYFNNDKECFALSHFTFTIKTRFFCQSCICDQLLHNHVKRDLGDPNFSCTTIVIPV